LHITLTLNTQRNVNSNVKLKCKVNVNLIQLGVTSFIVKIFVCWVVTYSIMGTLLLKIKSIFSLIWIKTGGLRGGKCPPLTSQNFFLLPDFFFLISLLPTLNHSLRGKLFFRSSEIYDSSHLRNDLLHFFKLGHSGMNVQKKEPRLKKMNSRFNCKTQCFVWKRLQNKSFLKTQRFIYLLEASSNGELLFFCFYYY
jgi:hypothetical protein